MNVQCTVARQRPLAWKPHYGGHVGDIMGCDHPSWVPLCKYWYASYGISNIFQHGGRPPFWILKILMFDHVCVIVVLTCCCIPNFIKIGSRVRPPDAHNCWMYNAPLLGSGRSHGNRIMAKMSWTWWDVNVQVSSKSVHWYSSYSVSNILLRPPSWIRIVILDHPRSHLCGSITLSTFGIDPIFRAVDFTIL